MHHVIRLSLIVALAATSAAQEPWVQDEPRHRCRIAWTASDSEDQDHGQISIEHGLPEWRAEFRQQLEAADPGTRFRLGKDFWTSFDTNRPIRVGKERLDPGLWFLAVEKTDQGFALVFLEDEKVRRARLDAFKTQSTTGGTVVPLEVEQGGEDVSPLRIALAVPDAEEAGDQAVLEIAFGPYRMKLPMQVERVKGGAPVTAAGVRQRSRVVLFQNDAQNPVRGQATVEHGVPEWRPEREQQLEELGKGMRWRLGSDFWTTFDAAVAVRIGKQKLPAGHYWVQLEREKGDAWRLVFHEPGKLRKGLADARDADATKGGIEVPLEALEGAGSSAKLAVRFEQDEDGLRLVIRFGPHALSAPFELLG